jgi:hypothetical protein
MFFWHVPAPNEALLISGSKRRNDASPAAVSAAPGGHDRAEAM